MRSLNKATIIGHLGTDPEMRHTPSGQTVVNFSVATNESWGGRDGQERQEKTEWHRIVAWGRLAEICNEYLRKGRQVYIEGRLQTRSWDDQQGQKRYMTEIIASNMMMLGGRGGEGEYGGGGGGGMSRQSAPPQTVASPPADAPSDSSSSADYFGSDDDLPF